jgi:hypothetical protein
MAMATGGLHLSFVSLLFICRFQIRIYSETERMRLWYRHQPEYIRGQLLWWCMSITTKVRVLIRAIDVDSIVGFIEYTHNRLTATVRTI